MYYLVGDAQGTRIFIVSSVHAYTSKVRARGEGLAVPCCVTADDVEGYEDLARGRNLFEYE